MAYIKTVYQDSPSTATPLNAQHLNNAEDGIENNDRRITAIEGAYVSGFNGRTGAVAPADNDYNIGQIAPLSGAQVGQVPVVVNHGTEQDPELVFEMGAGGGGGHSIIDSEGNTMPQESAMQFADSFVSDDDVNGKTIVENIKEHTTKADYDQATEDGFHVIDDGNDVPIGEIEEDYVEVTADGVKTYGQLLNELYALIDLNKVTINSVITMSDYNTIWRINRDSTFPLEFLWWNFNAQSPYTDTYRLEISSNSVYEIINSSGHVPVTTIVPTNGTVISLHYGSSSGIVELNTDARHCMMSDGVTSVEQKIDGLDVGKVNQVYTDWNTSLSFKARGGNGHALLFDWQAVMAVLYNDTGVISILDIIGSGASHFTSSISDGVITLTRDSAHAMTLYY